MTKDEVLKVLYGIINRGEDVQEIAMAWIKEQQEIVICKDCKWFKDDSGECLHEDNMKENDYGDWIEIDVAPDFGCIRGERE